MEIIEHEFVEAIQIDREDDKIIYQFKYFVVAVGTSFDYFGREDDKEIIVLSPIAYHKFEGNILVNVERAIETFIDYGGDTDFETVKIVTGKMKETEYKSYSDFEHDEEKVPNAYTVCPDCGREINHENDALTGFCLECSPNH